MLLLIDIGNTNITAGFHENNNISHIMRLERSGEGYDIDEFDRLIHSVLKDKRPEGAAICSVVPETIPIISNIMNRNYGVDPVTVDHKTETGLNFLIDNIEGLGADRIANAVAARKLYEGDLVVVDFGTATTFCLITNSDYRGGAIMPGIAMSADSLAEKTSKLPRVALKKPQKILGNDTTENILAGLIYGHAGAVERIISEIRIETDSNLTIIATGGLSSLITPYIKIVNHTNPHLTLEGLKFIYDLNTQKIH